MCGIGAIAGTFGKNGKKGLFLRFYALGFNEKLCFSRNLGDWGGFDTMVVKF